MGTLESAHTDQIHDVQLDYYGRRLATCSSDRRVKVFDASSGAQLAELSGHTAPVWQVSWAHPRFGTLIASCSFDGTLAVWHEAQVGKWTHAFSSDSTLHRSSVNSVAFAPDDLGLMLASASSDGSLGLTSYSHSSRSWSFSRICDSAHLSGCLSVSWANAYPPEALLSTHASSSGQASNNAKPVTMIASGGCDALVKLWQLNENTGLWQLVQKLEKHTGWVRSVAWAPSLGLPIDTIASAGQDGRVIAWSKSELGGEFHPVIVAEYESPVWSVSWSTMGNMLAVADSSGAVKLYKEQADAHWVLLGDASVYEQQQRASGGKGEQAEHLT
jgi:protein transport protein SEC13